MFNQNEFKGKWFSPYNTGLKFSGVLILENDNNLILEFSGDLEQIFKIIDFHKATFNRNKAVNIDIILGDTFEGPITLFKCVALINKCDHGIASLTLHADYAFLGIHFYEPSQIGFKKVKINYKYLNEWVNIQGFLILESLENIQKGEILIGYKKPNSITIFQKEDIKIFLLFEVIGPTFSLNHTNMNIRQEISIVIESTNVIHLTKLTELIIGIQDFLNFVITVPTCILKIEAQSDFKKYQLKENIFYGKINMIFKSTEFYTKDQELYPQNMLFTFLDFGPEMKIYISNWIENSKKLKPIVDLYFRAIYVNENNLQQQIINLTLAIEAYHNIIYEKRQKLNNGLKKLLDSMPDKLTNIFFDNKKDNDKFIKSIVKMRNRFIHLDENYENVFKQINNLVMLKIKLAILITILILRNIGFKYEIIYEILLERGIISRE